MFSNPTGLLSLGFTGISKNATLNANMLTVEGTYKDGKVELAQRPTEITQSRVLVTFLESKDVDLQSRGINEAQAGDLRARLKTVAEDWERPEASIYDEDRSR
jgi:hypothetical protein